MQPSNSGSNAQPGPQNPLSQGDNPQVDERFRVLLAEGSNSRPGLHHPDPRGSSIEYFRELLAGVSNSGPELHHPNLRGSSIEYFRELLEGGSDSRPEPLNPRSREDNIEEEYRELLAGGSKSRPRLHQPKPRGPSVEDFRELLAGYANMEKPKVPDESPNSYGGDYLRDAAASTDKPSLRENYTRDMNLPRLQELNFSNILSRYKNLPGLSTSSNQREVNRIAAVSKKALAQINASVEAKEVPLQADTSGTNNFWEQEIDKNPSTEGERRTQELPPYYGAFIQKIMQVEKYKYTNLLKVRSSLEDLDDLRLDILKSISSMLAERNREDELEESAKGAPDKNKPE